MIRTASIRKSQCLSAKLTESTPLRPLFCGLFPYQGILAEQKHVPSEISHPDRNSGRRLSEPVRGQEFLLFHRLPLTPKGRSRRSVFSCFAARLRSAPQSPSRMATTSRYPGWPANCGHEGYRSDFGCRHCLCRPIARRISVWLLSCFADALRKGDIRGVVQH